jgi:hypothetical protein
MTSVNLVLSSLNPWQWRHRQHALLTSRSYDTGGLNGVQLEFPRTFGSLFDSVTFY